MRPAGADDDFKVDICVVGAGVAGISFAREFIGTSYNVLVLESGGSEPEDKTQELNSGKSIGHSYFDLRDTMARAVGGTSHFWCVSPEGLEGEEGLRLRSLDPIDFERREAIPYSGWPFGKSVLDSYYDRASRMFGGGTDAHNLQTRASISETAQPQFSDQGVENTFLWWSPKRLFQEKYPRELEASSNIQVLKRSHVLEIVTNEAGGLVEGLLVASTDDPEMIRTVQARQYVLAAGGLHTPRLLLLSTGQNESVGIGNQHDLVGRFFMEHPHLHSGWFIPKDPRAFDGFTFYRWHAMRDLPFEGYATLTDDIIRRERLPNYCTTIIPEEKYWRRHFSTGIPALNRIRAAISSGQIPDQFGQELYTAIADLPNIIHCGVDKIKRDLLGVSTHKVSGFDGLGMRNYRLNQMSEQVPNPESRVYLSREHDRFGQAKLELNWQLTRQDINGIFRAQEVLDRAFRKDHIGFVLQEEREDTIPRYLQGGYHHMGTTRMHDNPKRGVVDANCKVHGVSNLHVAGSSVFPTSGCYNPTLTIGALALRLSDHIQYILKK